MTRLHIYVFDVFNTNTDMIGVVSKNNDLLALKRLKMIQKVKGMNYNQLLLERNLKRLTQQIKQKHL